MTSGGLNKINLVGEIFGGLTVIKEADSSIRGLANWLCLCECGNEFITSGYYLRQGRKKSCGCRNSRHYGNKNPRWSGYKDLSGSYWHRVRQGALARGFPLEISIEDAWEQFINQNKTCALTGQPLIMCDSAAKSRKNLNLQTASLDRIDSKKGYIKGNIQWIHKDINCIKMDLEQNYFIHLCEMVTEYAKKVRGY